MGHLAATCYTPRLGGTHRSETAPRSGRVLELISRDLVVATGLLAGWSCVLGKDGP
jgi:hypothetical protein